MNCVRPPLLKKPARGFGWSCGPCSRRQEKKLEARNTPNVGEKAVEGEEEEFVDEEEDDHAATAGNGGGLTDSDTQATGARPPTAEQMAQAKLWPFRYLGIHCRVEDALDYDDRIYPRASSRLGPKHQATVQPWFGHHTEFVKPIDLKKKLLKGNSHKKDAKLTKDTITALEASKVAREKRPKWVMDEPPGYVSRGDDFANSEAGNTAQLQFRLPIINEASSKGDDLPISASHDQSERSLEEYMTRAKALAPQLGLKGHSTNFLDKALQLYMANNYHSGKALQQLRIVNKRKDLKEPELTKEELRRFEDGVKRYGSELRLVSKHVGKTQKHGEIVRFYYMWKKTTEGKRIWGNYEGRKGKKQQRQTDSKLADDVADDNDDSAFDNNKAIARRRGFECKFCWVRYSPQWRRAPATAPGTTVPIDPSLKNSKDKNAHLMLALCQRCAYLWRCYAITWENPDEVAKKVASGGGRAWRRRIDEELLAELTTANVASSIGVSTAAAAAAASIGVEVPSSLTIQPGQEAPKKKQKLGADAPAVLPSQNIPPVEPPKKKVIEKPPEPPLVPEQPKIRILPCAICYEFVPGEETTNEYLCCISCRLTVHRSCYGVECNTLKEKWSCDMCLNDRNHSVSINYDCVLCSVREYTDKELMEAPKSHHKKKNDREKEKERLERELLVNATENYYRSQRERGKPEQPRQPLKKTYNNNWVHVVCAIFHYEIKFSNPRMLEKAEGLGALKEKYQLKCKLCRKIEGACVKCTQCQADMHVSCAQQHGYQLGFDITPVKGSRASSVSVVDLNGDKGSAAAVIFCKEHLRAPYNRDERKGIHSMAEILIDPDNPNSSFNALQAYARSHKQADISVEGMVRKSKLLDTATSNPAQPTNSGVNHRGSISSVASGVIGTSTSAPVTRASKMSPEPLTVKSDEVDQDGDRVVYLDHVPPMEPISKECRKCNTTVSPKWHPTEPKAMSQSKASVDDVQPQSIQPLVNGYTNGHDIKNSGASMVSGNNADQEMTDVSMGGYDGAGDEATGNPATNGEPSMGKPAAGGPSDAFPTYLCHKCYQRQRWQPTPPRMPTPPPEPSLPTASEEPPVEVDVEAPQDGEGQPPTPPTSVLWPSMVAQAIAHDSHRTPSVAPPPSAPPAPSAESVAPVAVAPSLPPPAPPSIPAPSPAPSANPYYGPDRLSNGVPRSPPVVAPPHPVHYAPPPQNHHGGAYGPPPPPPQNYRDARGVLHRGMPPHYHMPHLANGPGAEPPSFQYRRDSSGNLLQIPYVPPTMRPQAPSAIRSPPMQDRSSQGPHGPPEAAANPFAVPTASHSPPRQSFSSIMYGSPHHDRSVTPPDGFGREGRWSGEGPLVNGASASPSLRNLLQ